MTSLEKAEPGVLPELGDNSSDTVKGSESGSQTPQNETSEAKAPTSPRNVHGVKWVLVSLSLYIGALIYGLDTTIAADIQASVIDRFGHVQLLTWIGAGFPLGSVCAVLPVSAMYANFDLKYLFILSVILFEAGSALCGGAPTMDALIVGRVIAGVGGSGIFLGTLNYFSLLTSDQERGRYISGIGVCWGTGAVLGPVVGGAFSTSSATWRWAFYINLVVAAICAPVYIFYLPSVTPPAAPNTSVFKRLKGLDWAGFVLGTGAMVCFAMVLVFAGSTWRWDDGRTIASFVVSGVLLILTILQQYFVLFTTREARMFPPAHILRNKTLLLLNVVAAGSAANIYVPLYYIPLYFSFAQGNSALESAVRLLPYICFLATMNMVSGAFLPKINYFWAMYLVGGILMTAGGATLFTVKATTSTAKVYGYSIILGAGTGLLFQAGYTIGGVKTAMRTGSGHDVQRVISMLNLSQLGFQMGSLLIAGQIYQEVAIKNLSKVLDGLGFTKVQLITAVAGSQSTVFESLTPEVRARATEAITEAMSRVYIISIVGGALTVISALLLDKGRLFPKAPPAGAVAGGA